MEKTRQGFVSKVFGIFGGKEIDDDLYEELEEALIAGDVGVETALEITERLRNRAKADKIRYAADLKEALAEEIADLLAVSLSRLI